MSKKYNWLNIILFLIIYSLFISFILKATNSILLTIIGAFLCVVFYFIVCILLATWRARKFKKFMSLYGVFIDDRSASEETDLFHSGRLFFGKASFRVTLAVLKDGIDIRKLFVSSSLIPWSYIEEVVVIDNGAYAKVILKPEVNVPELLVPWTNEFNAKVPYV